VEIQSTSALAQEPRGRVIAVPEFTQYRTLAH